MISIYFEVSISTERRKNDFCCESNEFSTPLGISIMIHPLLYLLTVVIVTFQFDLVAMLRRRFDALRNKL